MNAVNRPQAAHELSTNQASGTCGVSISQPIVTSDARTIRFRFLVQRGAVTQVVRITVTPSGVIVDIQADGPGSTFTVGTTGDSRIDALLIERVQRALVWSTNVRALLRAGEARRS